MTKEDADNCACGLLDALRKRRLQMPDPAKPLPPAIWTEETARYLLHFTAAMKRRKKQDSDGEWFAGLAKEPLFEGLNLYHERKAWEFWCKQNKRQPTRRAFEAWLKKSAADKAAVAPVRPPAPEALGTPPQIQEPANWREALKDDPDDGPLVGRQWGALHPFYQERINRKCTRRSA